MIGVGAFGRNHARVYRELQQAGSVRLVEVVDPDTARADAMAREFGCKAFGSSSLTRLMALHYILRYSPSAWEALHGLVLPLGPIILMALFFMYWSGRTTSSSVNSEARAT